MVEAVLFDNDGVLVDTESAFFEVTRDAFAEEGLILTPRHWACAYLGEGRTSRDIARSLGVPEKRIDAVVDGRNRVWRKWMEAGVPLRPRVRETLEALHGKVRMAVVTGSPREQFELVHRFSGLPDFFEAVSF
jgi:beta-phosphoglucomutase-like phosphatase (HAD superfamily)